MNIRVRFQKTGDAKYISHLDLNRAFIRAIGRCELPVRYTEGFNPHPSVVFGPPLAVGFTSECEVLDFELTREMDPDEVRGRLCANMPRGLEIDAVCGWEDRLSEIAFAGYLAQLEVEGHPFSDGEIGEIRGLFSGPGLKTVKRGKKGEREIDVLDSVREIEISKTAESFALIRTLLSTEAGTALNPEYLVQAVLENRRIAGETCASYHRFGLFKRDGTQFR
jgi:radical SAM-linked protein